MGVLSHAHPPSTYSTTHFNPFQPISDYTVFVLSICLALSFQLSYVAPPPQRAGIDPSLISPPQATTYTIVAPRGCKSSWGLLGPSNTLSARFAHTANLLKAE